MNNIKYLVVTLIAVLLIVAGTVYALTNYQMYSSQTLTEAEALNALFTKYPELKKYQTTSLPPSTIESKQTAQGWYIAFIQSGSGLPGILHAECYSVNDNQNITFNGEYNKDQNIHTNANIDTNIAVVTSIDVETCTPIIISPNDKPVVESPTTEAPSSELPTSEGVRIGEAIVLSGVTLKPLSVVEDSRCPANANCVWAGRVTIRVQVNGEGKTMTLNQPLTIKGVTITLVDVSPQKTTSSQINSTEYRFTFKVAKSAEPIKTSNTCYIGGCSGQICSDMPNTLSTCEYREEYMCYKQAICERQSNGQCGWTNTLALQACLATY